MGVHGLTSFIQKYHDKHKEKIYLHDCPVVIDGCNLMFFLYFDWRQAAPVSSSKSRLSGSPLSKPNPLKHPHLFGGDYISYAQNVRLFFQHLKHCGIIPVVLFDGAYDKNKLPTAVKRFAANVRENVRGGGNSLKGITPGSSYAPVFMKGVFVEVLQEQKIPHFQTEGEADCTIAFVARKLGNCPILSSDSDFHIYTNVVVLPLHSLRFKKVAPSTKEWKKTASNEEACPSPDGGKLWTLHSQYVSLVNLCRKEFNFKDPRLLSIAAVILGNDWIKRSTFFKFHSNAGIGGKVKRNTRIGYILKWLGKQRSYTRVLRAMLSTVRESQREEVAQKVNEIVAIYEGLGGEEKVWKMIEESGAVSQYTVQDNTTSETATVLGDMLDNLSLDDSRDISFTVDGFEGEELDGFEDQENESDSEEEEVTDNNDDVISPVKNLPKWYIEAHYQCFFPSYLLKLARNEMVFLSPQAEVSILPSTHMISIPIIQAIGGLLLPQEKKVTLITRQKQRLIEVKVDIKPIDQLPPIHETVPDWRETLPQEIRMQIILETLGLFEPTIVSFLNCWPVSLKIWIISILYFLRYKNDASSYKEDNNDLLPQVNRVTIPVVVAILFSVMKNAILNPSGTNRNSTSSLNSSFKVTDIFSQTDPDGLAKLKMFYANYERVIDTSCRTFTRSYDISRTYNLSEFTCLLFHLHQLNRLLGDPFKAPRINSSLNNWFIFNLSGRLEADWSPTRTRGDEDNIIPHVRDLFGEGQEDIVSLIEKVLVLGGQGQQDNKGKDIHGEVEVVV